MSLEVQNRESQMFFEPQKQGNKAENVEREKMLFCLKFYLYLYFQQLYIVHFLFILNDFKGYKCTISKSIKLV
jgi:hypothetical protein